MLELLHTFYGKEGKEINFLHSEIYRLYIEYICNRLN
jgi:hypothetical protein